MKLLLWAVIVIALIWIFRSKKSPNKVDSPPPPSNDGVAEAMLRCAHCKTYFPASEAVFDTAQIAFCSAEHRRQHGAQ